MQKNESKCENNAFLLIDNQIFFWYHVKYTFKYIVHKYLLTYEKGFQTTYKKIICLNPQTKILKGRIAYLCNKCQLILTNEWISFWLWDGHRLHADFWIQDVIFLWKSPIFIDSAHIELFNLYDDYLIHSSCTLNFLQKVFQCLR